MTDKIEVLARPDKNTKNTVRVKEVTEDQMPPKLKTQYIQKWPLPEDFVDKCEKEAGPEGAIPEGVIGKAVKITIEVVDEEEE